MQINRFFNPPASGRAGSGQDAPSMPGLSTTTRPQPARRLDAGPGPRLALPGGTGAANGAAPGAGQFRRVGSPGRGRPQWQPPPGHLQPDITPCGLVLGIHDPLVFRETRVMTTHLNPPPLRRDPAPWAAGLDLRTNATYSATAAGHGVRVPRLPLADCGQYAAQTMGTYRVAPLHVYEGGGLPANHSRIPLHQAIAPTGFARADGHSGADFVNLPVPACANAVAFALTPEDGAQQAVFHYARIEQESTGYHLTHTDANWNDPARHPLVVSRAWDVLTNLPNDDQVRAFIDQHPNFFRPAAQVSTTPAQRLQNVAQFVEYCQRTYDAGGNGRYYYCTFQPPP